ncbi:MAG: sugar fermentation stimulation protein [Lachnospiraceae bacterium]|nr:sugar fermentation stimulation protein [Lachnospiraceae bacterium]
MRDDYVKRGAMSRFSGYRIRRKKWPIVTLLALLCIVFAGTFAALAREKQVSEETRPAGQVAEDTSPTPVASPEATPTPVPGSNLSAGAFGLWDPTATPTPTVYIPPGEEIWMADWEDKRTPVVSKGIYVSSKFTVNLPNDTQRIAAFDELLELIKRTELNTMVIDVKYDSGAILYDFDSELIHKYGTVVEKIHFIPEYIQKLHEAGVYVIARLVCFKDHRLAQARPDLALYYNSGKMYVDDSGSYWISPYKQEAWDYIAEVGKQCAKIGFDEINLDYVRFPTYKVSNVNWGPESATVSKTEAITKGVRFLCETLRQENVYISADVYGIVMSSQLDMKSVGQDFREMTYYLDYICPMVYPSHYDKSWVTTGDWPDKHPYEVITKSLGYARKTLDSIPVYKHHADVRPWLQDFTADYLGKDRYMTYDADAVLAEIKAVYDTGFTGWLLWNAKGIFTEDALQKSE